MTYFDNPKNQYSIEKIIKPPEYVKKEINLMINLIKEKNFNKVVDFGART